MAAFDTDTGAGRVLLDDGIALAVPSGALRPGSARLLRRGQRVVVELDGNAEHPVVRLVHLLTVPPGPPPGGTPGQAASAASTTDEPPRTN